MRRALGLFLLCSIVGCASAAPVLGGARPTPEDRCALSLGGAVRVPLGEELPEQEAARGGVAPVASFRWGAGTRTDLGLTAVGPSGQLDLRHAFELADDGTVRTALVAAPAVYAGALHEGGLQWGAHLPLLLGVEGAGLLELWVGPHVGLEHASSNAQGDATGLSAGGVIGLGVGFRHVHVLTELSAAYEHWSGDTTRDGVALTPAFALRLKL